MEETESPKSVQQSRCQYNQRSIKSIYLGQKEPTRIRSRRMKPPKNQNQNQTKKGKRIWRSSRKEKKPLKTKPKESCLYHQLLPSLLFSSLLAFSSILSLGVYCIGHPKRSPEKRFFSFVKMARNKKKKLWKRDNVDVSKLNIAESTTIHITQQLQKFFESKAEGIQIFYFQYNFGHCYVGIAFAFLCILVLSLMLGLGFWCILFKCLCLFIKIF